VERVGVLVEGTIGNWADMPGRTFDGWTNKMPQRIANAPGTWANRIANTPGAWANRIANTPGNWRRVAGGLGGNDADAGS
jgi:hypothetical protein